jgi:hypothetical protein
MEKVSNLLENWDREAKSREAAIEAKKSKKSAKNPQALNDDFIVDDDDEEENKEATQEQTEKHLFGDSSSDEEMDGENKKEGETHRQVVYERGLGREKLSTEKDLFGDSDEDDNEKDNAVEMVQNDLFGDSDEDGNDNENVVQAAGTKRSSMSVDKEEIPKSSRNKKMRMLHE